MDQTINYRYPKLIAVIGTNGTGKTFTIAKFVKKYVGSSKKVLVVTPHDNEWLELPIVYDIKAIQDGQAGKILYCGDEKNFFSRISNEFFNGLLVLDDCRYYLGNNPPIDFKQIPLSRKQRMMDVIFACHSIADMPKLIFQFNPTYILKYTTSSFESRKDVLLSNGSYDKLCDAQVKVNNMAKCNQFAEIVISNE